MYPTKEEIEAYKEKDLKRIKREDELDRLDRIANPIRCSVCDIVNSFLYQSTFTFVEDTKELLCERCLSVRLEKKGAK